MAIDVYLIVFHRYDTDSLKRLEWKYMVGITIITFVPALVFLFIRTDEKGPMYGSVTVCPSPPKNLVVAMELTAFPLIALVCNCPEVGVIPNCLLLRNYMVCDCVLLSSRISRR